MPTAISDHIAAIRETLHRHALPGVLFATVAAFFVAPSNIALNRTYYALLAPLTLLALRCTDYQRLLHHGMLRWIGAFIAFMTLSAGWSAPGSEPMTTVIQHGVATMVFVLLITATERRWRDRLPAWCAMLVTLHVLIISIVWYGAHSISEPLLSIGRIDNQLELASVYASMAAMCLAHYFANPTRRRLGYVVAVSACVVAIVLTGRRGPLLAFGIVAVASLAGYRSVRAIAVVACIAIAIVVSLALEPALIDELTERGASMRPEIWNEAWHHIRDSGAWLVGNGLGSSTALQVGDMPIRHYHDLFLATLFYGGLVGIVLLCGLLVSVGIGGLHVAAARPWLAAFWTGCGCMLTNGDRLVIHPHPVWLYFWLPATLVAIYCAAPSPSVDSASRCNTTS